MDVILLAMKWYNLQRKEKIFLYEVIFDGEAE